MNPSSIECRNITPYIFPRVIIVPKQTLWPAVAKTFTCKPVWVVEHDHVEYERRVVWVKVTLTVVKTVPIYWDFPSVYIL